MLCARTCVCAVHFREYRSLGVLDQVDIDCTVKTSLTLCRPCIQFGRKGSALKRLSNIQKTGLLCLRPSEVIASESVVPIRKSEAHR